MVFQLAEVGGASATAGRLRRPLRDVQRLVDPHPLSHLWILAAAGLIGLPGNELAAQVRLRAGKRLASPALVADGNHARIDGFVSLGVVASAAASPRRRDRRPNRRPAHHPRHPQDHVALVATHLDDPPRRAERTALALTRWGCRLRLCDELPRVIGVPLEAHRIETVDGLLDERFVLADGAEGPQRVGLEVGARLQY